MGLPRSSSTGPAAAVSPSPRRSRPLDRRRASPFLSRSAERLRRCALRLHAYLRPAASEPRHAGKVVGRRNAALAPSPLSKLTPKRLCARAEDLNWRRLAREVPIQLPNGVTFVHKGGVQSTRF